MAGDGWHGEMGWIKGHMPLFSLLSQTGATKGIIYSFVVYLFEAKVMNLIHCIRLLKVNSMDCSLQGRMAGQRSRFDLTRLIFVCNTYAFKCLHPFRIIVILL